MGNDDLVELNHDGIERETIGARLYDFGDGKVWVPKSLIQEESSLSGSGGEGTIEVPEWFAIKEGLI